MFVKHHIHEFDNLPKQTDRMRAVADLYRKQKGMPSKPKAQKKAQKGGGLLIDMMTGNYDDLLGGGYRPSSRRPAIVAMQEEKKVARQAKKAEAREAVKKSSGVTGAGWFDDFSKGFMLPFQAVGSVAHLLV